MTDGRPGTIVCDVRALVDADVATIDALARLQLTARRCGFVLHLRNAPPELHELLAFVGLDGVLPVEPGGQAEQGEERVGVEEERELGEPPV
ncbi:MAG: STAS domain-containing protein [Actinomycetota bacterium]|nr:STAS domain-containing protein [Actinomycetota bacterium]